MTNEKKHEETTETKDAEGTKTHTETSTEKPASDDKGDQGDKDHGNAA